MSLQRKTPLKRTPLRTKFDPTRALPRTPLKKKRYTPKPTKRAIEKQDAMRAARVLLAVRDGMTCRLRGAVNPSCFGPLDPHHLLKAGAGGSAELDNLVWLCRCHNTYVEDEPNRAHALGLVVRFGDTLEDAWQRMYAHGLAAKPGPSPLPAVSPYTGTEDDRCDICLRRGFRGLCEACETGSALR